MEALGWVLLGVAGTFFILGFIGKIINAKLKKENKENPEKKKSDLENSTITLNIHMSGHVFVNETEKDPKSD